MSDPLRWNGYIIDQRRAMRSFQVNVYEQDENGDPLPDDHYMAYSGTEPHYISLLSGEVSCDCADWTWQNREQDEYDKGEEVLCKHLTAVLRHRDEPIMDEVDEDLGF